MKNYSKKTVVLGILSLVTLTSCIDQKTSSSGSAPQKKAKPSGAYHSSGASSYPTASPAAAPTEKSIVEIAAQVEKARELEKIKPLVKAVNNPAPTQTLIENPVVKAPVETAVPATIPEVVKEVASTNDYSTNKRSILGFWITPKGGPSEPNEKNWVPLIYGPGLEKISGGTPANRYIRTEQMQDTHVINQAMKHLQHFVDFSFASSKKEYEIRIGNFACENPEGLGHMIDPKSPEYRPVIGGIDAFFPFSRYDSPAQGIYGRPETEQQGAFRTNERFFITGGHNVHTKLRDATGAIPARLVDAHLSVAVVDLDEVPQRPDLGIDKVAILPYGMSSQKEGYNTSYWISPFLWVGGKPKFKFPPATMEGTKAVLKLQFPTDLDLVAFKAKIKSQLGPHFSNFETIARAKNDTERLSACEMMGLKVSATEPIYSWEFVPMNTSCNALYGEFSIQEFTEAFNALTNPKEIPKVADFGKLMHALAMRLFIAGRYETGHQAMAEEPLVPKLHCFKVKDSKVSTDDMVKPLVIGQSIK